MYRVIPGFNELDTPRIFEELNWFQILTSRRQVANLTFFNKLLKSHLGFPALLDRVNLRTPSCTRSQRLFEVGHQSRSYVCPEAFPVQERELHIGRLLLQLLSWGYHTSRFWNFDSGNCISSAIPWFLGFLIYRCVSCLTQSF